MSFSIFWCLACSGLLASSIDLVTATLGLTVCSATKGRLDCGGCNCVPLLPVLGGSDGDGGLGLGSLSLSPPPEREPCRSAFLLRVVTGLTRTLIYAMIFTPCHAGGSVSVPMAGVMEVVFLGLSIQQHQVRVHLC